MQIYKIINTKRPKSLLQRLTNFQLITEEKIYKDDNLQKQIETIKKENDKNLVCSIVTEIFLEPKNTLIDNRKNYVIVKNKPLINKKVLTKKEIDVFFKENEKTISRNIKKLIASYIYIKNHSFTTKMEEVYFNDIGEKLIIDPKINRMLDFEVLKENQDKFVYKVVSNSGEKETAPDYESLKKLIDKDSSCIEEFNINAIVNKNAKTVKQVIAIDFVKDDDDKINKAIETITEILINYFNEESVINANRALYNILIEEKAELHKHNKNEVIKLIRSALLTIIK